MSDCNTVMAVTRAEIKAIIDLAFDYSPGENKQNDVFDIKITSVNTCTPTNGCNLIAPLTNTDCADILHNAWKNCESCPEGFSAFVNEDKLNILKANTMMVVVEMLPLAA